MTGYSVSTSGLGVSYGRTAALTDVTIDLAPDRIHGLLGRNGAGKSTTMRVLAGVVPPTAGHATVAGHDVRRRPPDV